MLGNHHWFRQDSSVTSNRNQLEPPWVNKEFHTNIQSVPKKSRTIVQGSLGHQEPERHQDCDPNLCMFLLACLPFSPCSQVFSVSNLLEVRWPLMSYSGTVSYRNCIWISASNFWGRDAESLCLGQATTLGSISLNQKRSDSIWKSYLVPTPVEWGAVAERGGGGGLTAWSDKPEMFSIAITNQQAVHRRWNIFSLGSRPVQNFWWL